jgi:hypothetical protein
MAACVSDIDARGSSFLRGRGISKDAKDIMNDRQGRCYRET